MACWRNRTFTTGFGERAIGFALLPSTLFLGTSFFLCTSRILAQDPLVQIRKSADDRLEVAGTGNFDDDKSLESMETSLAGQWLCSSQSPSPVVLPSTSIGAGLPPAGSQGYEVSGAVWHPLQDKLFVVHDGNGALGGSVTRLNRDGSAVQNWVVGGDMEGVTVADPSTDFVYLAQEQPNDSIVEFDFVRGVVTRSWDLTNLANCTSGCGVDGVPFPDPPGNAGIEAITFVPDAGSSGGVFYLGLQSDGRIYKVRVDLSSTTGKYIYLGHAARLGPWNGPGGVGIQGLDFDVENNVLWAMIGQERIRAMRPDGTLLGEWTLPEPSGTIEGIAMASTPCEFFVTWDDFEGGPQNRIRRYAFKNCVSGCAETCGDGVYGRAIPITVTPDLVAGGFGGITSIRVSLHELHHPNPANPACCPAPNFGAFEVESCTATGEQEGCHRWVGPTRTYFESSGVPGSESFRAARLQCTPHYQSWLSEGTFLVFGAEIVPSSCYEYEFLTASCMGLEDTCTTVSTARSVSTRRFGDVVAPFNPPNNSAQPDGIDIVSTVNKFRGLANAPGKVAVICQPNVPEYLRDVSGLDIVSVVDGFRGLAYPQFGPCPCPSLVPCETVACSGPSQCPGGLCVRTCQGGSLSGESCQSDRDCLRCQGGSSGGISCESDLDCPGGTCLIDSSCQSPGFCRDRCGRCTP